MKKQSHLVKKQPSLIIIDSVEENKLIIADIAKELKNYLLTETLPNGVIGFDLNLGIRFDEENEEIGIPVRLATFCNLGEEKPILLMEFEGVVLYRITNFNQVVTKDENGGFTVEGGLLEYIVPPSYSTIRGIAYARVSHTYLKRFLLPILDTKKMLSAFQDRITSSSPAKAKPEN